MLSVPIIKITCHGSIDKRYFDNWLMGFKSLQHEDLIAIEGYQSLQMPAENNFPAILPAENNFCRRSFLLILRIRS
jgi:hypothetical protein